MWNILTIRFLFWKQIKVTNVIIQIVAEHELLFREYKIQTETGEKLTTPKTMKIKFLLYNVQKGTQNVDMITENVFLLR